MIKARGKLTHLYITKLVTLKMKIFNFKQHYYCVLGLRQSLIIFKSMKLYAQILEVLFGSRQIIDIIITINEYIKFSTVLVVT